MVFTDISSNIQNLTVYGVTDQGRPHEMFPSETKVDKNGRVYYTSKESYSVHVGNTKQPRNKWFEYPTVQYRLPEGSEDSCKGGFLMQHFVAKSLASYKDPFLDRPLPNQLGNGFRLVPWIQMKDVLENCIDNCSFCGSCELFRTKDHSGHLIEAFFLSYMREIMKGSEVMDCDPSSFVDDLFKGNVDGYLKRYYPYNNSKKLKIYPFDVKKGTLAGEQRAAQEALLNRYSGNTYATFTNGRISQIFYNLKAIPVFVKPEHIYWAPDLNYYDGASIKRNFDVESFLDYNRNLRYKYPVLNGRSAPILDSIEELISQSVQEEPSFLQELE